MSSSEDSDIQIECVRIGKPKKMIPKLILSINVQDHSIQNSEPRIRSKNLKTDSNIDDNRTISNPSNKYVRRMPIALAILKTHCHDSKGNKNYAQDSLHNNSQHFTTQTCLLSSVSKRKHENNIFLTDQQKWNQTQDFFNTSISNGFLQKNPFQNDKDSNDRPKSGQGCQTQIVKFKQKTVPVFSLNRGRAQVIKQYHRDGNKIRTHWQKGLINGYTEIDYFDGGKFRGIYQDGNMLSGQMTFPNGFIYTGQFSMFTFHGSGKLKFPGGQIFQGNWVLGKLGGNGKITYPKGQIYYGQISNFKRDGNGYLYFQNGQKYVGQFQEGQISGYGQLHREGQIINKGYWVKGKYVGQQSAIFKILFNQIIAQKSKKASTQKSMSQKVIQSLKYLKQKQSIKMVQFKQDSQIQTNFIQAETTEYIDLKQKTFKSSPNIRLKKQVSLSLKML